MILRYLATALLLLASGPATADPLPEPLQTQRVAANALYRNACSGSQDAFTRLNALAQYKNDLAAEHALASVINNPNCPLFGWNLKGKTRKIEAARLWAELAEKGYPIAQSNHGVNLLHGSNGIAKDITKGRGMLSMAILGGYATAAVYLAENLSMEAVFDEDFNELYDVITGAALEGAAANTVYLGRATVLERHWEVAETNWHGFLAYRYYERVRGWSDRANEAYAALGATFGNQGGTSELDACLNDPTCDPVRSKVMRDYFD